MEKKYLTVSALTEYIKHKLELDPHLQHVLVKGEISNFYLHRMSGHMYLTLKDEHTQIKAVMYRTDNRSLTFTPESGMSVYVTGYVSVYKKSGQYQLYISEMEPSGIGALHLAFEQLKEKLQKANYFSEEYKKPIPKYPKRIAVITSQEGAAVRDIITTIEKRYPIVQLVILPVTVQGEQSVETIIKAIERANRNNFDTIILARGGGSLEDLASFNDERVAMAIFHSNIPIITGVGHETDTTISDFVADLRAPTPTAAAQLAVPSLVETVRTITYLKNEVIRLTNIQVMKKSERLNNIKNNRVFMYPLQIIREKEQRIDQLAIQLSTTIKQHMYVKEKTYHKLQRRLDVQHPKERLTASEQKINFLHERLQNFLRTSLQQKQHELAIMIEKLTLLNPLEIMKRGYSITYSDTNKIIKSTDQLSENDRIKLRFFDGSATCEVKEVKRKEHE